MITTSGNIASFARWGIVVMLLFGTIICYVDRLTISFLAPEIQKDLGISNLEYAGITSWFLFAYSVLQGFAGRFYDKVGTKIGYTLSITIWSVAAMLHAVARGVGGLSFFRFILGIGESGHWPGASKAVAEWFPVRRRAFVMGIINTGASLGSMIAPPLIVWLLLTHGWRATFIVTGSFGFVWVVIWLALFLWLGKHLQGVSAKYTTILDNANCQLPGDKIKFNAHHLYRNRKLWGITIARFFGDPIWWLYLVWMPLYLMNERGFTMSNIGSLAWLPYLAASVGGVAGGWFSGFLIDKKLSVNKARKIAMIVGTLFLLSGLLVINTESVPMMWVYISLTLFGFQFWVNNVQTLPSDIFAGKYVGSVAGMGQSGAGFGAMLFVLTTGWIVDHFSYTPILITAGLLGPLATISLLLIVGKIKQVDIE
jgi:ACS family hexuronate transporter-like MFS transporter